MTTISLSTPIEHAGTTYSELTFRPIKFRDCAAIAASENNLDALVGLVARLAGVPLEVAEEIDTLDAAAVIQALTTHLGKFTKKIKR